MRIGLIQCDFPMRAIPMHSHSINFYFNAFDVLIDFSECFVVCLFFFFVSFFIPKIVSQPLKTYFPLPIAQLSRNSSFDMHAFHRLKFVFAGHVCATIRPPLLRCCCTNASGHFYISHHFDQNFDLCLHDDAVLLARQANVSIWLQITSYERRSNGDKWLGAIETNVYSRLHGSG